MTAPDPDRFRESGRSERSIQTTMLYHIALQLERIADELEDGR